MRKLQPCFHSYHSIYCFKTNVDDKRRKENLPLTSLFHFHHNSVYGGIQQTRDHRLHVGPSEKVATRHDRTICKLTPKANCEYSYAHTMGPSVSRPRDLHFELLSVVLLLRPNSGSRALSKSCGANIKVLYPGLFLSYYLPLFVFLLLFCSDVLLAR